MKNVSIILIMIFPLFLGRPVDEAKIYLESDSKREIITYQQTGNKGMATFQQLDMGRYNLLIDFPQQEGKWIKEKRKNITYTISSYDPAKKTFYFQSREGYFAIKIGGLKKIEKESLRGIFRELWGDGEDRVVICQFHALRDGAAITVKVTAITAARFKKLTDKTKDISTNSIPGAK